MTIGCDSISAETVPGKVKEGVDRRPRSESGDRREDMLAAALAGEPVVHQADAAARLTPASAGAPPARRRRWHRRRDHPPVDRQRLGGGRLPAEGFGARPAGLQRAPGGAPDRRPGGPWRRRSRRRRADRRARRRRRRSPPAPASSRRSTGVPGGHRLGERQAEAFVERGKDQRQRRPGRAPAGWSGASRPRTTRRSPRASSRAQWRDPRPSRPARAAPAITSRRPSCGRRAKARTTRSRFLCGFGLPRKRK